MRNGEIAEAFEELASLYELDGAVVYRVVAYRNAAKAIREAGVSVAELATQGRAAELAGVGKTIAEKIDALLDTGSIPSADKLKTRIPSGLVEVTRIPGLGPKGANLLHDELGVSSIEELREAAEDGRLKDVKGFGKKAEENVIAAFAAGADGRPKARMLLSKALPVAEELVEALRDHPAAIRVELGGSARRLADTVKDIDIVASSSDPAALSAAFSELGAVDSVSTSGEAGAKAVTHSGLPVDLRCVRDRGGGLRAARDAVHPARATREPRRARGRARRPPVEADRAGRHPRRPPYAHDALGRPRERGGNGRGRPRARLRVHRDHRPLGHARLRQRRPPGRAAAPGRGDLRAAGPRHPGAGRYRDQRAARRLARLRGRGARAARLGDREPPHELPSDREGADPADAPCHGAPARRPDRTSHGPADRAPRGIRAQPRQRDREGRGDRYVPRDQREPRPARPERR